MKYSFATWITIFAVLIGPSSGMAQFGENRSSRSELGTTSPAGPNQKAAPKKPIDPLMNSLVNQRFNELNKNLEGKYGCRNLPNDPKASTALLIARFNEPRSEENRKYQAYCWQEADKLILKLKSKNEDALAKDLSSSLEMNRDSVKTQLAVESCPGADSEFRKRIITALEKSRPFDDLFRSVPVKTPPAVSEKEALNQLRKAIFSESLAESLERSVLVSKRHGIPLSPNLVDKVCPSNSICAKQKEPRDLKAFLTSRYENTKNASVDKVTGRVAFSSLSAAVEQLNKKAKSFNDANLHYETIGSKGAKGYSAKTSSAEVKRGSSDYYQSVDEILGSDMGSLLAHEPFKNQLKNMYSGVPFKLPDGETHHLFFGKINETSSSIEYSEVWNPLPEKLKILGGEQDIKEAALNALGGAAKYANELNRIEQSINNGRDPDYGIFSSGDPETKGLAIISKLNPTATARILLSNPGIARSGMICRMIDAGTNLEKTKEVEGRIQAFLGLGSIVVGVGATLLPTGVTQVIGPMVAGTGATFAVAGTAISGKATYDSYIEAQRTGAAYSATKNTDLKYDSEKATSEMITNAAQVVGDAAAPGLLKGLNHKASPARKVLNSKILSEVTASKKSGDYALGNVGSSEIHGAILARLKTPKDVPAINRAAKKNPKAWAVLLQKIKSACSGGLRVTSVLPPSRLRSIFGKIPILFFSVALAEIQYGCSLDELKGLAEEVRRFAGLDRSAVFEGSLVTVRRGNGTSMSNGVVTGYDEETGLAIVRVLDKKGLPEQKKVPWWELGHPYNISDSDRIPAEAFRRYEPGQKIEILENGKVVDQARYVAETNDKILIKTDDSGGRVVWLEKNNQIKMRPVGESARDSSKVLPSSVVTKGEVRVLFKDVAPYNPKIEEARNVRRIKGRGEKDIFHDLTHRKIAEAEGRIFENVPINDLPRGQNYTYVILENGEVVYGAAPDAFELGVKHFQLSNKRGVVAAGELRIMPDGTKYFNTQSGSYTAKIIAKGKTTNDEIAERVEALFSQSADEQVHYTDAVLIEEGEGILPQKYRRYCKDPNLDFGFHNRNLCD